MSKVNTVGPMSEGPSAPMVKRPMDAENYEGGSSMHPGFDHDGKVKMTARTGGKHKSFEREPIPPTL
jgi:hypothetical protein